MMPTPTLTDVDLTDPMPPLPGERERSAVRARAAQITRRRRFAVGAGTLGVAVIAILGAMVFTGGSSGTGTIAASIVVVQSGSPVEAGSTVTLDLKNADGSFSGQADASGTVRFGENITPGRYEVFITVDSAPAQPTDGIDIGSARTTYREFSITLDAGVNTIDLNTLTPATS